MRHTLCLLILAIACGAAQEGSVTVVDATRRSGIQCQLQRLDGDQSGYAVRLANLSGRGARVDYRALSRTTSTWTGTVILRPSDDALTLPLPGGADYFGADILAVTSGTVRETVENRTAADGTVQRITVLELIDEAAIAREQARAAAAQDETLALKAEVAALRRGRQDAEDAAVRAERAASEAIAATRQAQDESYRYQSRILVVPSFPYHHPCPHPVATPAPASKRELTWEEFRDQQLANERKVWKNF